MATDVLSHEPPNVHILPGETFKAACRRLGLNYDRARSRRRKGLPDAIVFASDRLPNGAVTTPLVVHGISYPSVIEAIRQLKPAAGETTIRRWLDEGCAPDVAFARDPQPTFPGLPVRVGEVEYASLNEAWRQLQPPADVETIRAWIATGLSPDEAFAQPPDRTRKARPIRVFGMEYPSLAEAWRQLQPPAASPASLGQWIRKGLSLDEAFVYQPHEPLQPQGTPFRVCGKDYPNLKAAYRDLKPPASYQTLINWLDQGLSPDEAFERSPNPGYANGIIYVVTHRASGKQYVGLTSQALDRRWSYHLQSAATRPTAALSSLQQAIRTHGPEAFDIQVLDHAASQKDLERKERAWIARLGTQAPHGYNLARGGSSGGAPKRAVMADGRRFASVKAAVEYIARTRGITIHAAAHRLRTGRLDTTRPQTPVMVDGTQFPSIKKAADYVARTRGITKSAAEGRVTRKRIEVRRRASKKMPSCWAFVQTSGPVR